MTWLLYALISLICFSVYEILSRTAGVNAKNPRVFSCLYNGLAALFALYLFFLEPLPPLHISWLQLLLTVVGMTVWILFSRLEYYAHKHTEASTMAILLKLGPAVTFLLSSMIFREVITGYKLIGLAAILVASYLVMSPEKGTFRLDKGAIYSLALATLLGVAWTFDKAVSPWWGVSLYTIMAFALPAVGNAVTPLITMKEWKKELKGVNVQLFLLAILTATGFGSMMKALSTGEASRVIPIATSTTPLVVLMAAVFLNERKHLRLKIFATILTVVGIVCLS